MNHIDQYGTGKTNSNVDGRLQRIFRGLEGDAREIRDAVHIAPGVHRSKVAK